MKKRPYSQDTAPQTGDLPVPWIAPLDRRRYVAVLLAVLVLCALLLVVVVLTMPALLKAQSAPESDGSNAPLPDTGSLSTTLPESTPPPQNTDFPASDTQSPTHSDVLTAPSPEQIGQTESLAPDSSPADEQPEPVVIVEHVLLGGSVGLEYRSYGNGTCILTGAGEFSEPCLVIPAYSPEGDAVIAIAQEAFRDLRGVQVIQLPATLRSIGERAFWGCYDLVRFCVAADNTAYVAHDGVLYSRDMGSLIAYPLGRSCATLTIPASVHYISAAAVDTGALLECIRYEGSVEEWKQIEICAQNDALYTLPKMFQ